MFKRMLFLLMATLLVIMSACGTNDSASSSGDDEDGIKVGVLFSLSGEMAVSEAGQAKAALLAIKEINEAGGVNGKELIPVQEDYNSDPSQAATKIRKLIMEDKVVATVGTHTSASRQAALPIVEEHNSVLIYPTIYEGEEYSDNIIYTGTVPNQQLEVFAPFITENLGKKVYFVGNDYVFPVQINNQLKKLLELNDGEIIGEDYVPMGHAEFSSVLNNIKQANPDVIFAALAGDSHSAFFSQYADYGFDVETMPIASSTVVETDLVAIGKADAAGHYGAQAYFENVDTPENEKFKKAFHEEYGENEQITSWVETAYYDVYLLKQALEKVDDPYDADALLDAFVGLEFDAPQGKIRIDENHHTWLYPKIAKINEDGDFEIIQDSDEPLEPEPWSKLLFPDHDEPWKK